MDNFHKNQTDFLGVYEILKLIFGEKFALGAIRLFIYLVIFFMLAMIFKPETRGFGIVVLGGLIVQAFINALEKINT